MFPWTFPQMPHIHSQREVSVFNCSVLWLPTPSGFTLALLRPPLHVISDIFSINVPSCCDYPCWQLDTDTYSNSVLPASAAWAQPSVCREGTPNAALCRDTCTASQLQAVLVNYRWTSAQDDGSAERWDARAKQQVLLKWQHSFESLCKRAKACSRFCVCCCIMLRRQAEVLDGFLLQECTGMTQVGFSHAGALRRAAGSRHSAGM